MRNAGRLKEKKEKGKTFAERKKVANIWILFWVQVLIIFALA